MGAQELSLSELETGRSNSTVCTWWGSVSLIPKATSCTSATSLGEGTPSLEVIAAHPDDIGEVPVPCAEVSAVGTSLGEAIALQDSQPTDGFGRYLAANCSMRSAWAMYASLGVDIS